MNLNNQKNKNHPPSPSTYTYNLSTTTWGEFTTINIIMSNFSLHHEIKMLKNRTKATNVVRYENQF